MKTEIWKGDKEMGSLKEAIMNFQKIQRDDAENEIRNHKGKMVVIDPRSYIAKEILYQTAILQKIEEDTDAIKRLLEREQRQKKSAANTHSTMG